MEAFDLSRVLELLRSIYPLVQTLEEFAESLQFKEGRKATLVEASDSELYRTFTRTLVVCRDGVLRQTPSCAQITTMPELLAFVLNTIKNKKRRNVLSYGYVLYDSHFGHTDLFKLHGEITLSAAYIHGSDFWKKLNQRLGTDITKYLLESCAVFLAIPPTCLLQVCGVPIYDCVTTETSSRFCLSKPKTSFQHRWLRKATPKPKQEVRGQGRRRCARWSAERPSRAGKRKHTEKKDCEKQEEKDGLPDGEPLPKRRSPAWRSGTFPPPRPSSCFIRILGLLYSEQGFKSFLLNRKLKGRVDGPRRLRGRDMVKLVFFEGLAYLNGVEKKPKKLPKRFHQMEDIFTQLLRRHRKCPYIKLLERMCPIGRTDGDMNSLLPQHNTSHQVYLFTRECLHRVIPNEFWGSSHNRVRFFCCVKRFLSMGKFDRLSLSQLLWKMRVNDCNWLKISKNGRCPPSEHRYRERTLGQFLVWLVDGYVVGLVRAFFYVTESMGQKNALRFYRHPVWRRLQDLAFSNHIFKGQLELLTQKQVAALPKTVGLFRLRYIPKSSGMRPITRMTKMNFRSWVRSRLKELHNVLQVCVRERPSLLGSTVFGVQDIHRVLGQFSALQKEYPCPLYFVKVDVRGAYDSLPHDKLLQVVSEVLLPMKRKTFFIRSYAHVWADPGGGVKRAFRRQADLQDNARASIRDFVADLQEVGKIRDTILVEQHFSTDVCGKDVFEFFREMLAHCVIQFEKKIFRQCRGIPQGSVVSMFLCCLCYGHMENSLFRHITEEGGCLMRLVDDFLLITPDQSKAQFFLKTLMAGVPEYGCFANPEKVVVNFAVDDLTNTSGICQLPFHCLFPWCGLLLDTNSLDVYGDYSSYAGLSLRWSLTLGSTPCAGQHMSKKLMALLKLKCQAIFLDLKVRIFLVFVHLICNVYLLTLFHVHVVISKNPQFFQLMIWKMAKKTHLLIRQHNRGDCLDSPCSSGRLQYEAVELMFCISFLATMSHYRHMYKCLIPQLHKRKRKLEGKLGDVRLALVRQASTPQIPDDFQLIRI
uniref:Telomerase reverse transcriptase n=1 Tax=Scleropages formosus TaxID=113540 RepID=A0A8C9V3V4_SCLFO